MNVTNKGESAASFYCQVAALVQVCLVTFNHKISNNSATTETTEKISTDLESFEFWNFFDAFLTEFKNCHILLIKISHRFLATIRLFNG